MTQAELQAFYNDHIKDADAEDLANEIYELSGDPAVITDGIAKHMNGAVIGKDVKDDIVKLSMLIRAYNDLVVADADAANTAATTLTGAVTDISNAKNALMEYNSYPLNDEFYTKTSGPGNGVQYTWNADGSCTVNGTPLTDSGSVNNLYYYESDTIPEGMAAGGIYKIVYKTTDDNVKLSFVCKHENNTSEYYEFNQNGILYVPSDCVRITIRLRINNQPTINNATISVLDIFKIDAPIAKIERLENRTSEIENALSDGDWLMTEFEEVRGWWTQWGSLNVSEHTWHSQMIPVKAGDEIYTMYFGGTPPQHAGGAFFDENKKFSDYIGFPVTIGETVYAAHNVEQYNYVPPDATDGNPGRGLTYSKMWKIIVPQNAAYISINLRTENNNFKGVQSLSSLPMLGMTGTGNYRWANDPDVAKKKNKKIYIIGPSTVSIDRAYRSIYDASIPAEQQPNPLPTSPIVGFQEYLIPYYDKVISLGFNGQGYMSATFDNVDYAGVAENIINNDYENSSTLTLEDADEVVICANGNGTGPDADHMNYTIGDADSTDKKTFCGAVNALIDEIRERNTDHACMIYLSTRWIVKPNDTRQKTMNQRFREIAALKNVGLIDEEMEPVNYTNYKFLSYDSNVTAYAPYGGHPNNAGSKLRGEYLIGALLRGGDVNYLNYQTE